MDFWTKKPIEAQWIYLPLLGISIGYKYLEYISRAYHLLGLQNYTLKSLLIYSILPSTI